MVVKQDPGAGSPLAVDVAHVFAGQVGQARDALGIAASDVEALLAIHQIHQDYRRAGQILGYAGDVVFARLGIEEMGPGQMGIAPAQSQ